MTIGPDPMTRIDEISSRFGMGSPGGRDAGDGALRPIGNVDRTTATARSLHHSAEGPERKSHRDATGKEAPKKFVLGGPYGR